MVVLALVWVCLLVGCLGDCCGVSFGCLVFECVFEWLVFVFTDYVFVLPLIVVFICLGLGVTFGLDVRLVDCLRAYLVSVCGYFA